MTVAHDIESCLAIRDRVTLTTAHDLPARQKVTDDGGMDVIDELKQAVATARESRKRADGDHERVKELLIKARIERGEDFGPAELEIATGRYFDRATISRLTSPELGDNPPRKTTRRRTGAES